MALENGQEALTGPLYRPFKEVFFTGCSLETLLDPPVTQALDTDGKAPEKPPWR